MLFRSGIGAQLSQVQNGLERVICYGAKKLSKAEKNYSATKGELLAGITFMKKWSYYLHPKPFIWRTDHNALRWIRSMEQPRAMESRWLETLAHFDFTIQHRPGKEQVNADILSRLPHIEQMPPICDDSEDAIAALSDAYSEFPTITSDDWKNAFHNDTTLLTVKLWILEGKPSKNEATQAGPAAADYFKIFETLSIKDGKIYTSLQQGDLPHHDTLKLCLPENLQTSTAQAVHNFAHQSHHANLDKLRQKYYFPKMYTISEKIAKTCTTCQRTSAKQQPQRHTLVNTSGGWPWQKAAADLVGPLPISTKGNRYILTVKDCFTRFIEAIPLPDATTATIACALETHIFCRYGMPESLITDRGRNLISQDMNTMFSALDISRILTPAYNPKSNGIIERSHRDLKRIIRALIDAHPADWETHLPATILALNSTFHRSISTTPFFALNGRNPVMPHDLRFTQHTAQQNAANPLSYGYSVRERLDKAHDFIRHHLQEAQIQQQKTYRDKNLPKFQIGDLVYLTQEIPDKNQPSKLSKTYNGPWKIVTKINSLVYEVFPNGT